MKTIAMRTAVIIFFLFTITNAYSYNIRINKPSICEDSPTFLFTDNTNLVCEFGLQAVDLLDTDPGRCVISIEQNGTSVIMYDDNFSVNQLHTITLNVLDFPNLCFNEPARLKFDCSPIDLPILHYYAYAHFIVFNNAMSCKYGSITNGSAQLINEGFATFFRNSSCSVSSSNYYTKQYKVTFTLNGNFTDHVPEVVPELSLGFSGSLPQNQQRWAYKIYQTPAQAEFITFVYHLINITGQDLGWYPCHPDQATVVYKNIYAPLISGILQVPNPCSPPNNTVFLHPLLSQGNGNLAYEFRDSMRPPGTQFIISERFVKIIYAPDINLINSNVPPHEVFFRVANQVGSSPWFKYRVNRTLSPSQCPFIATGKDEDSIYENPLMLYSNDDNNVKDFYILQSERNSNKENIEFTIQEMGEDVTSLDLLKLKQITVDPEEEVAVTKNGTIVNYRNQSNKAKYVYNDKADVSAEIYEKDDSFLEMKEGDNLKIEYEPDGSKYMMLTVRQAPVKQNDAGIVTNEKGYIDTFLVRSYESDVCLELKGPETGEFTITAKQDFIINKVAIVKNLNTAKISEQKLRSAIHNKHGDVSSLLAAGDEKPVTIGPGEKIDIEFSRDIDSTIKNVYLIEALGKINSDQVLNDKINSGNNLTFNLSNNIPNPFNPVTKINFEIADGGNVKLTIYDITGREIKTLINEFKSAGSYDLNFDGSNLASGIYFYTLETKNFKQTKRMTLLK
ncbi:MAG: T9SS type A sorting domain-containing protein [Ignavibacteria bacterium]